MAVPNKSHEPLTRDAHDLYYNGNGLGDYGYFQFFPFSGLKTIARHLGYQLQERHLRLLAAPIGDRTVCVETLKEFQPIRFIYVGEPDLNDESWQMVLCALDSGRTVEDRCTRVNTSFYTPPRSNDRLPLSGYLYVLQDRRWHLAEETPLGRVWHSRGADGPRIQRVPAEKPVGVVTSAPTRPSMPSGGSGVQRPKNRRDGWSKIHSGIPLRCREPSEVLS